MKTFKFNLEEENNISKSVGASLDSLGKASFHCGNDFRSDSLGELSFFSNGDSPRDSGISVEE